MDAFTNPAITGASTDANIDCGGSWYYYPQHYCSSHTTGNLDAQYNKHAAVVKNQCFNKCRKLNTAGTGYDMVTTDLPGEFGVNGESLAHCSGNHADFTAQTDVLCLPIEECTTIARDISILDGIDYTLDVNGYYKRCYINDAAPSSSYTCGGDDTLTDAGALTEASATDKVISCHTKNNKTTLITNKFT